MSPTTGAGLYVHVPFCARVCPYCDFAVLTGGPRRRDAYVDALLREIELWADPDATPRGWRFDTLYLGGGTPSCLSADRLGAILDAAREAFDFAGDIWIAMEANPEDVDAERLATWRRLGVRMLSLGVQSFDPGELELLGRRHDPSRARAAVQQALDAGFDTVSMDLIYALPDQLPAAWRRQLDEAVALGPQHLSCYQLTFHEGTPFGRRLARGQMHEMPDDRQAELLRLTLEHLAAAGYEPYEMSNFARAPEHRSRHNRKYWSHAPYLGIGPSSHSFDGDRTRWWNRRDLASWQESLAAGRLPIADRERLTDHQLALEALLLGLRTPAGLDLPAFEQRFGIDLLHLNRQHLQQLEQAGLIIVEPDRLAPTLAGLAIADSLAVQLDLSVPSTY